MTGWSKAASCAELSREIEKVVGVERATRIRGEVGARPSAVLERAAYEGRLETAAPGRGKIVLVRGDEHYVAWREPEQIGSPTIHPGVGFISLEEFG